MDEGTMMTHIGPYSSGNHFEGLMKADGDIP